MPDPNPQRRNEEARKAILTAAMELSTDPGFQATSVEAIAKRAGVGKQTIYRWWQSKGAVVLDALNELALPTMSFPDTGDVIADLRTQLAGVATLLRRSEGKVFAGLVSAAQNDDSLSRTMIETILQPRVDACRERLERAQRQGQLRRDVDLEEVIELLYGPLYYRLLFRTQPVTTDQPAQIIDLAFTGLRPKRSRRGSP